MIFNYKLNSLSEEEICILLYVVNHCPKTSQKTLDYDDLKCYRLEILKAKLDFATTSIKEEYKEKLEEIKRKVL